MNKVTLVGNVGSVEVKEYERDGQTKYIVQVSVATSDGYKKGDEWVNETEWHKCIFAIGNLAERAKSIGKGDTIEVNGSIKSNNWTDKDGNKHKDKEIAATSFRTWRKAKTDSGDTYKASVPKRSEMPSNNTEQDDDLPF